MALRDLLVGQDPRNVQLPGGLTEAQRGRGGLLEALRRRRRQPTAGRRVEETGRRQFAGLARRLKSARAGLRGPSALLAERQGRAALAEGGAQLAAQTAAAAQEAEAQEVERAEIREAALIDAFERGAITEEQLRKERAKPGILSTLLTGAGAAIGAKVGGPGGAETGGMAGQALGRLFTEQLR